MSEETLSKERINAAIDISQSVIDQKLDFQRLSQIENAIENQQRYNTVVKPKIEKYKQKYVDKPNVLIRFFLTSYIQERGLGDQFEATSYSYYGQKVYPYVWGAITKIDPLITDRKDSHYPQLYVLINNFGIHFGFGYGYQVNDNNQFVQIVRSTDSFKQRILDISKRREVSVFGKMEHKKDYDDYELIDFKSLNDVEVKWSRDLHLINYYKRMDIPTNVEDQINLTFDHLLSLFLKINQVEYSDFPKEEPDNKPSSSEQLLLRSKKQIILYGPPGTGKTYHTKQDAIEAVGEYLMQFSSQYEINHQYDELKAKGQIEFITFHPSYSYEEFVEGITVDVEATGEPTKELKYKLKQGIFKRMVIKSIAKALDPDKSNDKLEAVPLRALMEEYRKIINHIISDTTGLRERSAAIKKWWDEKPRFVLIIDEINRGDISKIFGELITLLEADKRLGMENELTAKLPYSHEEFGIPPNLYIVGTMNTADKSIALIDIALRRRFGFIEMTPDFTKLEEYIEDNKSTLGDVYEGLSKSIAAITKINERICKDSSVGRDRQIGHSFLFKVQNEEDLILVWRNEVLPLLEEYYYGRYPQINKLLFDNEEDSDWISQMEGIKDFEKYGDLIRFLDEVKINE